LNENILFAGYIGEETVNNQTEDTNDSENFKKVERGDLGNLFYYIVGGLIIFIIVLVVLMKFGGGDKNAMPKYKFKEVKGVVSNGNSKNQKPK
jgi:hypothetical protein